MKSAEELSEEGIVLIATGMFRASEKSGPAEAVRICRAAKLALSSAMDDLAMAHVARQKLRAEISDHSTKEGE